MAELNWDDLRYFLALARDQRASAAGKRLGVKHTTVARRLDSLESRLNTRLFDRTPRGYALTQAGEQLYEHAVGMEEHAQALDREIQGMDTVDVARAMGVAESTVRNHLFQARKILKAGLERDYPALVPDQGDKPGESS